MLNCFFAKNQATNELEETKNKPKAAPLTPEVLARVGTINQVKTVQKIINPKLVFTLPMALKALTNGVVAVPKAKLAQYHQKGIKPIVHF